MVESGENGWRLVAGGVPRQAGATAASIIAAAMNHTHSSADTGFSYSRACF